MGLDTRLSIRMTAKKPEQPALFPESVTVSGEGNPRYLVWHALGIVFIAWAVLSWFEQAPIVATDQVTGMTLSDVVIGKWSCDSRDQSGSGTSTYMHFGPEGSFERRSDDVGSLFGDYVAGPQWVDISLTQLPALEKYGMDSSINQKMRLTMAQFTERRLIFDSEVMTNGLGSRRWTCART